MDCTVYISVYMAILVTSSFSCFAIFQGAHGAPILFSEIMLMYGFLFVYIYHQNGGYSAGFRFLA